MVSNEIIFFLLVTFIHLTKFAQCVKYIIGFIWIITKLWLLIMAKFELALQ